MSPFCVRAVLIAVLSLGWIGPGEAADRIRIEIDGVERHIADNVRSYLALGRYLQRDDLTDPQVRRLADRAVDEATDALRPFGYYEPVVKSRTTRDDENWIVRLVITPGEPVRLTEVDVRVTGPGADDTTLRSVIHNSSLKPGVRLEHPAYERLKTELLRGALERGYLDAKFTRRELIVDPKTRTAAAHVVLDTGGRYYFGSVQIEQDAINDRLLAGFVRFAEGQPYSPERVRSTQFALEDSNYYATVSVVPGDPDPATMTVPVTIHGERNRRDRYSVSAGYGTDTDVRGKFTWENRLVNDRGHRWQVELTASSVLTEAIARYIIPVGDPSLEKLEFSTGYIDEEIGDLGSERVELIGGFTEAMGRWQRVLFLKIDKERSTFPDGTATTDLLLIPGVSYASLPPNFLTGWVRDAAYYLELTGSPQTLGSDASYLRFVARAEKVWSITGPWHLRLRGEIGSSWINEFSELPASQRFFAGGDRSVRGFALNELSPPGPPDADGNPTEGVGGENKLIGSIEIERDLPRDFRLALFYDTGNAFNDWQDPLEYSVGVGVRWKLPMLMLGIDVAQALSEPGKNPRLHLNITQVL
ncbi:MAG TPA: BamA/TamA family outer membrane protein [Steroidobacteraceae bacterium]